MLDFLAYVIAISIYILGIVFTAYVGMLGITALIGGNYSIWTFILITIFIRFAIPTARGEK